MNKIERSILRRILLLARESFTNHGCNDFFMDDTPENYKFAEKFCEEMGDGDPFMYKGKICLVDYSLMEYFAEIFDDKT